MKPVLQAAALEVGGELLPHAIGQASAFGFQLIEKRRVIPLDDLVEQGFLGLVALLAEWYTTRQGRFPQ